MVSKNVVLPEAAVDSNVLSKGMPSSFGLHRGLTESDIEGYCVNFVEYQTSIII